MPTPNPRLLVVVTPEQHELLADLAKLQGRSSASFLRELLDNATPILRSLRKTMRAHAVSIEGQTVALEEVVNRVISDAHGDDHNQLDLVELVNASARAAERPAPSVAREERPAAPKRAQRRHRAAS